MIAHTAAWWGIVPALVVGGLLTNGVGVAWTRLFPVLWRLDRSLGRTEEHRR